MGTPVVIKSLSLALSWLFLPSFGLPVVLAQPTLPGKITGELTSPTSSATPATTPPPAATPTPANSLISPTTGIDYTPLQKHLQAQQWQAANDLTRILMLRAAQRDRQGWFTAEDIQQLPCWDLQTIDNLWKTYSDGRFGFSVQYGIFVSTGNRPGRLMMPEAYDKFGDQVGWRKDNQWIIFKQGLDYRLNAPRGHLPNPRDEYQINGGRLEYTNLTKRLSDCQIVTIPSLTPSPNPQVSPSPKPSPSPKSSPKPKVSPSPQVSPSPKTSPSPTTPIMPKKKT
jgi:hypothetical protein